VNHDGKSTFKRGGAKKTKKKIQKKVERKPAGKKGRKKYELKKKRGSLVKEKKRPAFSQGNRESPANCFSKIRGGGIKKKGGGGGKKRAIKKKKTSREAPTHGRLEGSTNVGKGKSARRWGVTATTVSKTRNRKKKKQKSTGKFTTKDTRKSLKKRGNMPSVIQLKYRLPRYRKGKGQKCNRKKT